MTQVFQDEMGKEDSGVSLLPPFLFLLLGGVAHVPFGLYESQRRACRSWLFTFTVWVRGIELRSPGLAANPFTLGDISPAPAFLSFIYVLMKTLFILCV